ncbi:hypothetical protein BGW80DRAFT_1269097 [Lactifluus volemus]|nr:hypothetical protein BGW80DRAFT_1269097 [Lactifluus volemus]
MINARPDSSTAPSSFVCIGMIILFGTRAISAAIEEMRNYSTVPHRTLQNLERSPTVCLHFWRKRQSRINIVSSPLQPYCRGAAPASSDWTKTKQKQLTVLCGKIYSTKVPSPRHQSHKVNNTPAK